MKLYQLDKRSDIISDKTINNENFLTFGND
jgi:hypothetical protein